MRTAEQARASLMGGASGEQVSALSAQARLEYETAIASFGEARAQLARAEETFQRIRRAHPEERASWSGYDG
jgi:hypothetical protein